MFGTALITMAAIMLSDQNAYGEPFLGMFTIPILAVSFGAAVCLLAFYGCMSAIFESRGLLMGVRIDQAITYKESPYKFLLLNRLITNQ